MRYSLEHKAQNHENILSVPFGPGQTREQKLAKFRLLFPSMAGVLMMARVSSAPQRREQMLMEARNFFIKCFAEE
jgi:TetR/AcrR family transcriptional regulator, transcriptional repressor for nem operon